MIGKVISGGSFGGTVGYVMKEQSRVLEARGVEPPGVREMVEDFEDQARLNPRLRQNVGHISLSFSPEDAPKLTDERMTQIAREYMQKMGITDTQYLLVRHLDQPHPHCHLIYNRVGDHGQTISDRNIKLRNAKVCRELTERFGLHLAPGKEAVRRERLREPDRTRYEIYDTIRQELPRCRNWNELRDRLKRHGIETIFKRKGVQGIIEGVKFARNGFIFSGSKVDRAFSFSKLDRHFGQVQQRQTALMSGLKADRLQKSAVLGASGLLLQVCSEAGAPSPQREAVEEAEAMAQDRCRLEVPGQFRCRRSTRHLPFHPR
mgnify:CR=1 FL=1